MENKTECKVVLYGISPKNCDTIKKARKWLDEAGVDYRFHDHRADGLDPAALDGWLTKLGWEALLNTRGTTFRALPEEEKQGLDNDKARALLLAHPAMIKRPLLDCDGELTLGFKADHYQSLFFSR
ncbi:ArsC family reductase [Aeromonas enteropelogenes]|uniref:ArsC family reductase n=1 Tax=Aeromonas enteropelogenes TaxID=29489 RepID=UPI003BA2B5E6